MNRERLKIIGFYVLAALIIARVVITPLQHSLQDKKALLKEYEDTYKMRMLSFERYKAQEQERNKKTTTVEGTFLESLYGKDIPYIVLQSDVIQNISGLAQKQGVTLLSFNFSEPTPLKMVSEVPIVVQLKGEQKGIVALLREMEKENKKLVVRRFEDAKNGPDFLCTMTVSAFRLEK
jgi:hypothetical protein